MQPSQSVLVLLLVIVIFPVVFIAMWRSICALIGWLSGWRSLAAQLGVDRTPDHALHAAESGMVGLMGYNMALNMTIQGDLLVLWVSALYSAGHRPLAIHRHNVEELTPGWLLFKRVGRFRINDEVVIRMSPRMTDSTRRWLHRETSPQPVEGAGASL